MVTMLIRCRVADYDAWRRGYDAAIERDVEVRSFRVWRGIDDPNLVVIEETYESRAAAEALLNDPAMAQEMAEHGVDAASLQVDFFDEVASGSR
jgi:quinol monooxygenase YgiN